MNRLLGASIAWLGTAVACAAAESANTSSEPLTGTIAFSSLAPRGWDLYLRKPASGSRSEPRRSRLTRHGALDFNAAFSPDGRKIAFVSDRDGNLELYMVRLDSSGLRRLTTHHALDDHPTWSPDARRIAFTSTRRPGPAGQAWNAIYVLDIDSSNVQRLSAGDAADYSPAWSPRGDLIAFASGSGQSGQSDIFVMRPDGQQRRLVTKNGGWPTFIDGGRAIAFHRQSEGGQWEVWRTDVDGTQRNRMAAGASMPRATPDGTRMAVVAHGSRHRRIAILDVETGMLQPATDGKTDHWNPSISPDGQAIVYHAKAPDTTTPNVELWGAPPETRLKMARLAGAFPAFSPDGKQVALTGGNFARVDVMNRDGSQRKTIFQAKRRTLFGMSWSRKPERVTFSHGVVFGGADSTVNIKAVSPDGTGLVTLTSDAGNDGFPSYSPDGRRVVFRSGRDGSKNLYIMDRSGQNLRRLTQGPWTDTMANWSPTGKFIAFASDRDGNFDIWLIRPDGTGLRKVIGGGGRDNHPYFSPDSQWIVFTSQRAGFSAEEVSLPPQPQPYGDLFVVRKDGSGLLRLTHNGFEEGTPAWASITQFFCMFAEGRRHSF